jgi:hypothetical protein
MTKLKRRDAGLGNPFPPRFRDSNGQRRKPDLVANAVEPSVLKLRRRTGWSVGAEARRRGKASFLLVIVPCCVEFVVNQLNREVVFISFTHRAQPSFNYGCASAKKSISVPSRGLHRRRQCWRLAADGTHGGQSSSTSEVPVAMMR